MFLCVAFSNETSFANKNIIAGIFKNSKKIEKIKTFELSNFCYLEFSAFPTQIEYNTFGIALGYRMMNSKSTGSDFSIHVMRNACKEIHIAGKADHLFYLLGNTNVFSPYIGFGIIAGVAPEKQKPEFTPGLRYDKKDELKDEYALFVNGEVVMGVEFILNKTTSQFFELTYYAQSTTLQLSLGIGF